MMINVFIILNKNWLLIKFLKYIIIIKKYLLQLYYLKI